LAQPQLLALLHLQHRLQPTLTAQSPLLRSQQQLPISHISLLSQKLPSPFLVAQHQRFITIPVEAIDEGR